MNVTVTGQLEAMIRQLMASGRYDSPSEVVGEALLLFEAHVRLREMRREELRREIAIGIEQADRGQVRPFDPQTLKQRVRERLADGQPLDHAQS